MSMRVVPGSDPNSLYSVDYACSTFWEHSMQSLVYVLNESNPGFHASYAKLQLEIDVWRVEIRKKN